jgi:phage shock protein C
MENIMQRQLYRSKDDRMLGGVCGGLGEYLGIDPTFIRIFFFILIFGGGTGFWIYLLLWILIPEEDMEKTRDFQQRMRSVGEDFTTAVNRPHPKSGLIVGGGLILLGLFWLLEQLNISWLWWWDFDVLWPVLLIVGGGVLLYRWFTERRI